MVPDEAYARLIQVSGMLMPWALATVTQLNIPELIGDDRLSADELARESGADPAALRRLLRYLALRDVLVEGPAGVFGLGSLGQALRQEATAGRSTIVPCSAGASRSRAIAMLALPPPTSTKFR